MRIDARFIESNPMIQGVYAYCYTGTSAPESHDASDVFFNTSDGTYSIHDGTDWGTPASAGTRKFLSLTDGRVYYLENNAVASKDAEDETLYFAALNGLWYYSLGGALYLAGTANPGSRAGGDANSGGSDTATPHSNHAPDRPKILSPADNETDINQAPQVQCSEYSHYYNAPMYGRQIQVSASDTFASTVYELTELSQSTVFQVPLQADNSSYFSAGTKYYVRVRYQDKDQNWSEWSPTICFITAASFPEVVLKTPVIVMPSNGGVIPSTNPVLAMSSPEALAGTATFETADWQIATDREFTSPLYSAAGAKNLTLHETDNVDLSAEPVIDFYVRGRQKTSGGIYTPWSAPAHVMRQPVYDKLVFGIRRIFSKTRGRAYIWQIDEDGNEINIPKSYFDRHPLYTFPAKDFTVFEGLTSSMAFVPPCWMKCSVYDNEDGDMVLDLWLSPYYKSGDGWMLHPAFVACPNGFYHGKYLVSYTTQDKKKYPVSQPVDGEDGFFEIYTGYLREIDSSWHTWTLYERRLLLDLMQAEYATFNASLISGGKGYANNSNSFIWRGFYGLANLGSKNGYPYMIQVYGFGALPGSIYYEGNNFPTLTFLNPALDSYIAPEDISILYRRSGTYLADIVHGYDTDLGFDLAFLGIASQVVSYSGQPNSPYGAAASLDNDLADYTNAVAYIPYASGLFAFVPAGRPSTTFGRISKKLEL